MTKLLDLDAISPPQKTVKFGGKKYPIVEMTVGLFVAIKQMEGKDLTTLSMADQVTSYAELVQKLLPTVTSEALEKLSLPQLQQVFTFAMEVVEEDNEQAAGEEAK